MIEAIHNTLQAYPWMGLLLVVLLAWLEYVFPPAPGDSIMLFACFLAGAGTLSLPATLAACLGGSIAGALTAYAIGARLGRSYFFLRSRWARSELKRLERGFARFGARMLLINRFLPGVRGVFLYGAGIGRLPWRAVLVHSTLSNILWVALIAWGGIRLGSSWDEVQVVFRRYVWAIAIGMTVYFVFRVARARQLRRRDRENPVAPPT
jgi:membrane protein DedA with SNARE-associated domain